MSTSRPSPRVSPDLIESKLHADLSLEPLPDPAKFEKHEGETEKQAAKRRNAIVQADYNASACVAVYMLLMTFSQKGIDKLREYFEQTQIRYPDGEYEVSEGFDEGQTPV